MKDYIVTVEETYFDATKFDFNKFYIVTEKDVEYKCLLKTVEKNKATFITIVDGEYRRIYVDPCDVKNGEVTIKEIEALEGFVFLGKNKPKYWDLYYNTAVIKVGKCYELKIGDFTYNGFCSKRDKNNIFITCYSSESEIGVIHRDPTMIRSWGDDVKYIHFPGNASVIENSITNGTVMTINLNEIIEDSILFREMI